MNRNRIILGGAAVVALAILAVVLLTRDPPSPPETAKVNLPQQSEPQGSETATAPQTANAEPAASGSEQAPATEPKKATEPETAPAQKTKTETTETGQPATASTSASTGSESAGQAQAEQTPQVAATPKAAETEAPKTAEPSLPAVAPQPVPPSFDVVRVERNGDTVIAGRAAPGSTITVYAGTTVLGTVVADWRGQWVLVVDTPLVPGSHELSLEARTTEGAVTVSENVVVVSVPRPQVAEAQQEEGAREDGAQAPAASTADSTAADTTTSASTSSASNQPATQTVGTATSTAEATQQAAAVASATASQSTGASQSATDGEQPIAVLMPRGGEGAIRVLQQPESPSRGLGEGTLILESVNYDDHGRATVGGRAEPGARLIVYLDEKPVAQTVAGADGLWSATLVNVIAPGLHRLRVDQVDAGGQAIARVETPFSRAEMVTGLSSETAVVVQPGNSLWRIARRIYGRGVRYSVIYQANQGQIRDPDLIYPGQIFVVPSTN